MDRVKTSDIFIESKIFSPQKCILVSLQYCYNMIDCSTSMEAAVGQILVLKTITVPNLAANEATDVEWADHPCSSNC
jgi:hypothetical protein